MKVPQREEALHWCVQTRPLGSWRGSEEEWECSKAGDQHTGPVGEAWRERGKSPSFAFLKWPACTFVSLETT